MSHITTPVQLAAPPALVVSRTINAPRERVFAAWTDARLLAQWFAPAAGFTTEAESDPRPGGSYRIRMCSPAGAIHTANGVYQELVPPTKLVLTWAWLENTDANGSMLTIELLDLGNNATQLTLTHSLLPSEISRQHHEQGWNGCLNRLVLHFDPNATIVDAPAPPMSS